MVQSYSYGSYVVGLAIVLIGLLSIATVPGSSSACFIAM